MFDSIVDPCPGCGRGVLDRHPDKVCRKCAADLNTGREFKQQYDRETTDYEDYALSRKGAWGCGWPIHPSHIPDAKAEPLVDKLYEILTYVGVTGQNRGNGFYNREHVLPRPNFQRPPEDAVYRRAYPGLQGAVEGLIGEINRLTEQSYQAGVTHGQDLLVQLARGEVAISDFDAAKATR